MTKPTITQSTTKYAIFRKDSPAFTVDYAINGITYDTMAEANGALDRLKAKVAAYIAITLEVAIVSGEYRDDDFGMNPFVYKN